MASIEEIIIQSINPFDPFSFKAGNFWLEKQEQALTVDSIHLEAINAIDKTLDLVCQSNYSRTVLLHGDSGAGKTYLLGRLKHLLNEKAFFAYIGPWPDSSYIWRHTLRQTVDSLVHSPEGKNESQLLLWLKGLSAFRDEGLHKKIWGERRLFIHNLSATYPSGIYNKREFFGVLYDLTIPELYPIACDWLRGDDLPEEDLEVLKVKNSIDSEEAAKGILANFGRIAADSQPIVLCFDNLDSIPILPNGFLDLQAFFNINSTIHNEYIKNYLIIVSCITNTLKRNLKQIQPADLVQGRIQANIRLQPINIEQIKALWAMKLHDLHQKAANKPLSDIFPLTDEELNNNFPGGKTLPRVALSVGSKLFEQYKQQLVNIPQPEPTPIQPEPQAEPQPESQPESQPTPDLLPHFELLWQDEYRKVKKEVTKNNQLAVPELIKMLQEALLPFGINKITNKIITGKYGIYSFMYQSPDTQENIGIVWQDDPSLSVFHSVMKGCQRLTEEEICHHLYLIRASKVGKNKHKGFQIYKNIFSNYKYHVKPTLNDVWHLAAYYNLVKSALGLELVLDHQVINLQQLQELTRKSQVLSPSKLLQKLGIMENNLDSNDSAEVNNSQLSNFMLNIIKTQGLLGVNVLLENVEREYPDVQISEIQNILKQLTQDNHIKIMNPDVQLDKQLVSFVPAPF